MTLGWFLLHTGGDSWPRKHLLTFFPLQGSKALFALPLNSCCAYCTYFCRLFIHSMNFLVTPSKWQSYVLWVCFIDCIVCFFRPSCMTDQVHCKEKIYKCIYNINRIMFYFPELEVEVMATSFGRTRNNSDFWVSVKLLVIILCIMTHCAPLTVHNS